jgi:hypothetical protein
MMHGLNTYDYGARQYYSVLPVWDRIDPLCEKDYGTSPYVYCTNNPVNKFEPDGKTDYRVNSQGQMYESTSIWMKIKQFFTGNNQDRIFSESSGKLLVSCKGGTIQKLTQKTMSANGHKVKQTSFSISDNKTANKVYGTLIKNTNVEWAQISYKNKGVTNSVILTNHSSNDVSTSTVTLGNIERIGAKSIIMQHSHPVASADLYGNMGSFINLDPSAADIKTARLHPRVTFAVNNLYNNKLQYYNGKGIYKEEDF